MPNLTLNELVEHIGEEGRAFLESWEGWINLPKNSPLVEPFRNQGLMEYYHHWTNRGRASFCLTPWGQRLKAHCANLKAAGQIR